MDRLERLLDLVHVLQSSSSPVSLASLKELFPDYAEGNDEAVRRKFERDKAELARIGLVLRYVTDDDEGEPGYVLDEEASFLPELELAADDRALLANAGRAALANEAFPYPRALRLALGKLGVGTNAARASNVLLRFPSSELGAEGGARIATLVDALARRKRLSILYRKPDGTRSAREVDAYGVFGREGAWYLVGHDHLRNDVRVFRASRIEEATPNAKRPAEPDYPIPEGFDVRAYQRLEPHRFAVHPEVVARIRVDPEVAFLLERSWGTPDDESVFTVPTTHLDAIVDRVLRLGTRAELLSPEEGRAAMASALRALLEAHGAA